VIGIKPPYKLIVDSLSANLPNKIIKDLPNRWEKIGDVLILRIPPSISPYQKLVARVYADILKCRSVLQEYGEISGIYRTPQTRLIFGDKNTETIHIENAVRFRLDPQKIMFSSGNIDERKRMAMIAEDDETVLDLFAGIGYFSVPMAVFSSPKQIIACEINPIAYQYLKENIMINGVIDRIQPIFGDNRKIAPRHWADRVLLGYLDNTISFLPIALGALKKCGGTLHFHDIYPRENIPNNIFTEIRSVACKYFINVELLSWHIIKSYAPGIVHTVFDVRVS
jgi:tRNA wybutosine-synthesizing protein 2